MTFWDVVDRHFWALAVAGGVTALLLYVLADTYMTYRITRGKKDKDGQ